MKIHSIVLGFMFSTAALADGVASISTKSRKVTCSKVVAPSAVTSCTLLL